MTVTSTDGGTVTANQVVAGGNPGAYRTAVNTVPPGNVGNDSVIIGIHLYTPGTYDPSIQGALASVDFGIDFECPANGGFCFGQGQAFGIALRQGGQDFAFSNHGTGSSAPSWNSISDANVAQNDFALVQVGVNSVLNNSIHPDFSASGGLITFGFFTDNNSIGSGYTIEAGYDNWSVNVNRAVAAVPAPGTAMLLALGLGLAGLARRRGLTGPTPLSSQL